MHSAHACACKEWRKQVIMSLVKIKFVCFEKENCACNCVQCAFENSWQMRCKKLKWHDHTTVAPAGDGAFDGAEDTFAAEAVGERACGTPPCPRPTPWPALLLATMCGEGVRVPVVFTCVLASCAIQNMKWEKNSEKNLFQTHHTLLQMLQYHS